MSFRSRTKKYGTPVDEFVNIDGYSRNLVLEEKLERESIQADDSIKNMGQFNPRSGYAVPSWWEGVRDPSEYGWGFTTHQKALDYLKLSQGYYQAKINLFNYRCSNYPRDPVFCQHSTQYGGTLGKLNNLISIIQSRISDSTSFEILPQVFAEEDPSVNSGLNGNEQESQVVNYPQSANVRIIISNISMFSTSIPINDISELQILSNASNDWRYTLIGTSTNQPLMTLSGLINKINSMIASVIVDPGIKPPPLDTDYPWEEESDTTDHVEPPEVEPEVPMVTVTPTEPGQVNWIPEPFFSFINNVFRR